MDRLQKKCVIVSASIHGLLASALLFGSAFLAPPGKSPDLDVLTVIPDVLTDAQAFNPVGSPNVKQPPALPPPAIAQPPPPAPQPKPESVVKPPEPIREKSAPPKPADETDFTKAATGRHQPVVNPNLATRKSDPRAKSSSDEISDATERAQAKAAADTRRKALAGALAGVGNVATSSTSVDIPPGPGGQAFANYNQVVKSVYWQAWIIPSDVENDRAITKASVTIARDGTVLSARITSPSGDAAVDASVQRTLERVRTIGREFPAGAKEDQRTFTISFNLKAKRQLG